MSVGSTRNLTQQATDEDFKEFPKTQEIRRAPPFQINLFTSLSLKVAAFWRLTISLSWGWRHFPGVPEPSDGDVAAGVALGVEGPDCVAIYRMLNKAKTVLQVKEERWRPIESKEATTELVSAHKFEDHDGQTYRSE